ncbi:MAG: hypothetical protein Terrestrivirus1_297 [Terrestrivirus sp.]|uniref:Uncharacterized protein n=1 Tax=Terrestrivirus sp. TaxID=2487775 RepID=A0A3G4ZPA0_9VIRU|nr:MAG: hypothetical protein Terrestrivirus1_297 [Terrestrivirus sp.]
MNFVNSNSNDCDDNDLCYDTENFELVESGFYKDRWEIDYEIEFDLCVVSDLFIYVKRSQLGERTILDVFSYISLIMGHQRISRLSLEDNLFIAKILGKTIIECGDTIKIPIPIFEMSMKNRYFGTKFPICLTKNQSTRINLIGIPIHFDIGFYYKKYDVIRYYPTENVDIFNTELLTYNECREYNIEHNVDHTYNLQFCDVYRTYYTSCNLMMIKFEENEKISECVYGESLDTDQDLNYNQLKQIKLSRDNEEIFIWNAHDNDIITMRHLNTRFYMVSLPFNLTSKNDIKRIFYEGYDAKLQHVDINFFNEKLKISFEFDHDDSVTYNWVYVSIFNKNVLLFDDGICYKTSPNMDQYKIIVSNNH